MSGRVRILDLELLIVVQEEGNVTQAAKRVGITEPALSKRIRLIERRVQAHLFDRNHEGAAITNQGHTFIERTRVSVEAFHQAVQEANETQRTERHKLRIGTSSFLPPSLIDLMHSIELRLYRNLSIEIVGAYSSEISTQLQHHEIDLALVTSPPHMATITTVQVASSPFMIVCRAKHPLAAKPFATLTEVAEYPWVFFHRNVHPPLYDLILQRMESERRKAMSGTISAKRIRPPC